LSRCGDPDSPAHPMSIELKREEIADIVPSLQRYFREELDTDLSEMRVNSCWIIL
jgi:hypothetical protein